MVGVLYLISFQKAKIVNMLYGWFNLLFIIGHSHIFQNFQRYTYWLVC